MRHAIVSRAKSGRTICTMDIGWWMILVGLIVEEEARRGDA